MEKSFSFLKSETLEDSLYVSIKTNLLTVNYCKSKDKEYAKKFPAFHSHIFN